jgi:DNA-binding beta-propeller fold protein YncE
VKGSPFRTGIEPEGIAIDFTGLFVYVTNNGTSTISAYKLNPISGTLTRVTGSPFKTGRSPQQAAVVLE